MPPNPNLAALSPEPSPPMTSSPTPNTFSLAGAAEDDVIRRSSHLSREELLRRRSRRVRQLATAYRRLYWALAEEMKVKHRDYSWEFGLSPLESEPNVEGENRKEDREDIGGGGREERKRCGFSMCKSKAMPLTRFCHMHILADRKQTLYKPCNHLVKSGGQGGNSTPCGKPVLRSAVPSLCHVHFQRVQRNVQLALKKAGANLSSSSKPTPRFSLVISEYVREIQARRRETLSAVSMGRMDIKEEKPS